MNNSSNEKIVVFKNRYLLIFLLIFMSPLKFSIASIGGFQLYPYYILIAYLIYKIIINPKKKLVINKPFQYFYLYNILIFIFFIFDLINNSVYMHQSAGILMIVIMSVATSVYLMQTIYYNPYGIKILAKILAYFCLMLSIAAILEFLTNIHLHDTFYVLLIKHGMHIRYTDLTYGNPNDLGQILVVLFPFVIYQIKYCSKITAIASIVLVEVAVIMCSSRLSLVAMIILLIFCLFSYDKWLKKVAFINLVAFVIAIIAIYVMYAHSHLSIKMHVLMEGGGASIDYRFALLIDGLKMIVNHPFGSGIYGFQQNMMQYNSVSNVVNGLIDPHNYFLNIFVNYGVIGFFLFLSFIISIISMAYKARRLGDRRASFVIILSVIGFVLTACNSSSSFRLLWLIWYFPVLATMASILLARKQAWFSPDTNIV